MSNEEIVSQLKTGSDQDGELIAQLYTQCQYYIFKIAKKYCGLAEIDDLVQEGFFGLCRAVQHYRVDMGNSFLTYATYWIEAAMQRYIERQSAVSMAVYQRVRKYRKFISHFMDEHNREPTETEICTGLNLSQQNLATIQRAEQALNAKSLDARVSNDADSEECTLGDVIPGKGNVEQYVLDKIQREELKEIWSLVDELPENQSMLLRLRYQKKMTMPETDKALGKTVRYTAGMEAQILQKLRRLSKARRLFECLNE
ncbi:MAG: sigma-70 family RNA polymerase sigma factor [Lachnospiraceae bacterium]|nr:sigma-70 family RNA polymerase sigma factor [Lachnospiraceae bacterium]